MKSATSTDPCELFIQERPTYDTGSKDSEVTLINIRELYPDGVNNPLLPETFSREQFAQGNHYECFMLSALATLVRYPDVIRNCFVTQTPRRDGRYTFQFFRGKQWVMVEIDDRIAVEEGDVLFIRSPTEHWWPLLLEKAYAKFYMSYSHLDGCTMQEVFHDLTGNPVLNIPMDPKLAKAAGASITEGAYWIDIGQKIQSGQYVCSVLTKSIDLDSLGLQKEQQYSILEIFSLTGTSAASDIVIRLHNPFEDEEYVYKGPLNSKDSTWTPKLRSRHDVDDERSFFMPLNTFLKVVLSVQMCYMSTLDGDATYFDDEWAGETAGGNPTAVTWRKNPSYLVRNSGGESLPLTIMIKQDDQRRFTTAEENTKYVQCGIIVTRYSYPHPIPTKWITGNNHKPVFKSLFLNSRDVSNTVVIPPNSLCYLVPCCFSARSEARFSMAVYRTRGVDYSKLLFMKLSVPDMDWLNPATEEFTFPVKEKERVDFYVDEETDVHILLHQTKPYVNKNGGDAMTEDYMGVYVYDDTDNKVAGVHAATNFREMSVIHHLPRSGRFALSLTCPRAKSEVTGYVTIVASSAARVRIVDRPEDAGMFDNEDEQLDENEEDAQVANPIDYTAVAAPKCEIVEADDGNTPFEDKRFMLDNRTVTNEPWLHIGDLYPGGKKQALMPERLSREQFEQGDSVECCCLIAFAALAERHPQVIQNCFVTKRPRRDGRYTFRFHRYGHWVKVEIDDRIPVVDGGTVFCRSPTGHWWPLLLEKAYAKFYTSYQNMEGCTPQEVFHDFTGNPVLNLTLESKLAHYAGYDVTDMNFWAELRESLKSSALTALTQADSAEAIGLENDGAYAILDIVMPSAASDATQSNVLMKMHNPIVDREYTGPMNRSDEQWTEEMRGVHEPSAPGVFYMPLSTFLETFVTVQQLYVSGVLEPCWNFNSEWGEGTNGGNPTLVTWRQNPLYVVRNTADNPLQLIAMIRQPDQRHKMHQQINRETNYIQCGIFLSESTAAERIPTYLVTGNNHRPVYRGLFANSREVSSVLTVPANSLCYLVPSAMHNEMSKFLLSYFYLRKTDERSLFIERLQVPVARQLPAIEYINLQNRGKERVDFIVDVPTDVHILVRQVLGAIDACDNDFRGRDHVGFRLCDINNNIVSGHSCVHQLRELGLVCHLKLAGVYCLEMFRSEKMDSCPCHVEVVAMEEAHVRITGLCDRFSFPEVASSAELVRRNCGVRAGVTRSLPKAPNRISISAVNSFCIAEDYHSALYDYDEYTKVFYHQESVPAGKDDVDARKTLMNSFLRDKYLNIPTEDLNLLANHVFVAKLGEVAELMSDPLVNASHISRYGHDLHALALQAAADLHACERDSIDQLPHGVPLDLLGLNADELFCGRENVLRNLKKDALVNASEIALLESELCEFVNEKARKMIADQRDMYLTPQPCGVSYQSLALDDDDQFHVLELELLKVLSVDCVDADRVRGVIHKVNSRLNELALSYTRRDRDYLTPEPYGVSLHMLPLDDDSDFRSLETKRQWLLQSDSKDSRAVADIEDKLNALAHTMAASFLDKERMQYLDDEVCCRLLSELNLNEDKTFLQYEHDRRALLKHDSIDLDAVREIESHLQAIAVAHARKLNAAERDTYMHPSYRCLPRRELPLDEDAIILQAEAHCARLQREHVGNEEEIVQVQQLINERANIIASEVFEQKYKYVMEAAEGIPWQLLKLESDESFMAKLNAHMEMEHSNEPNKQEHLVELEQDMTEHVTSLAQKFKRDARKHITRNLPFTSDDMSFDCDGLYAGIESRLYNIQAFGDDHNGLTTQDVEEALRKRAKELSHMQLKEDRAWLDQQPLGRSIQQLPLNHDEHLVQLQRKYRNAVRTVKAPEMIDDLKQSIQTRVYQIAAYELCRALPLLNPRPRDVDLSEVPEIGHNNDVCQLIQQLEATDIKQHTLEIPEVKSMYDDLNTKILMIVDQKLNDDTKTDPTTGDTKERMRRPAARMTHVSVYALPNSLHDNITQPPADIASAEKWNDRETYLNLAPAGVPLRNLPLDAVPEFTALERERRSLKEDPVVNARGIADVEKELNAKVLEIVDSAKWAESTFSVIVSEEGVVAAEGDGASCKALVKPGDSVADVVVWHRRRYLDLLPEGVPVRSVQLDADALFGDLEKVHRRLLVDASPRKFQDIADIEERLNERCHDLAAEQIGVVYPFLDPVHENIELNCLSLGQDANFVELCKLMEELKSGDATTWDAAAVADMERRMNLRAHELAVELKQKQRAFLSEAAGDVPLSLLRLDEDCEFASVEKTFWATQGLLRSSSSSEALLALRRKLMDRVRHLAQNYVDDIFSDVRKCLPVELRRVKVNLRDDEAMLALLRARFAELTGNGTLLNRSSVLAESDSAMVRRACELATHAQRQQNELQERECAQQQAETQQLQGESVCRSDAEATAVYDSEDGHFAASGAPHRAYVEQEEDTQHDDVEARRTRHAHAAGARFASAKSNIAPHSPSTAAEAVKLHGVLRKTAYGVPVELVPVMRDPQLADWVRRCEEAMRCGANTASSLRAKLQNRVDEMAKAMVEGERGRYLSSDLQARVRDGEVALEEDDEFHSLEVQRAVLCAQLASNNEDHSTHRDETRAGRDAVSAMETALAARADALVRLHDMRHRFLDSSPEGLSLRGLALDKDVDFVTAEGAWRTALHRAEESMRHALDIESSQAGHDAEAIDGDMPDKEDAAAAARSDGPSSTTNAGYSLSMAAQEARECQRRVNARAHDVARAWKDEVLSHILKPVYHDIPVQELNVFAHTPFRDLAGQLRRARYAGDSATCESCVSQMHDMTNAMAASLAAKNARTPHTKDALPSVFTSLSLSPPSSCSSSSTSTVSTPSTATLLHSSSLPSLTLLAQRAAERRAAEKSAAPDKQHGAATDRSLPLLVDNVRSATDGNRANSRLDLNDALLYERLHSFYEGVPVEDIHLQEDDVVRQLIHEEEEEEDNHTTAPNRSRSEIDVQLHERIGEIAREQLRAEREAFLPALVRGLSWSRLPLNTDATMTAREHELRRKLREAAEAATACANPSSTSPTAVADDASIQMSRHSLEEEIAALEDAVLARVDDIAAEYHRAHRGFIHLNVPFVTMEDLSLDEDDVFLAMEEALRRLESARAADRRNAEPPTPMANRDSSRADTDKGDENIDAKGNMANGHCSDDDDAAEYDRRIAHAQKMINDYANAQAWACVRQDRPLYVRVPDSDNVAAAAAAAAERLNGNPTFARWEAERYAALQRKRRLQEKPRPHGKALLSMLDHADESKKFMPRKCVHGAKDDDVGIRAEEETIRLLEQRLRRKARELLHDKDLASSPGQHAHRDAAPVAAQRPHELPVDAAASAVTHDTDGADGWDDVVFMSVVRRSAERWIRLPRLYPEGLSLPLIPAHPSPRDVLSAPGDVSYLGPFLAALSRHPPLLWRLFQTTAHPGNEPYVFSFFSPNSRAVLVPIDDRIPCTRAGQPKFTQSPLRAWWPLLVEKAYAKFVGGYVRMNECASHETLRDLTGRPVTHHPFDTKLSREVYHGEYRTVSFWRRVRAALHRGDVFILTSNDLVPDGVHPRSYYALMGVYETLPGSEDPADVVVKVHNVFADAPFYDGPLCAGDPLWTDGLRELCGVGSATTTPLHPSRHPSPAAGANHASVSNDRHSSAVRTSHGARADEFLYLPQPVLLRNFGSMQRCHINCGDRLTVSGAWEATCAGGSPRYTTFRHNPVYRLENTSTRRVTVLAELRHSAPVFYDTNHIGVYHSTALALLQPRSQPGSGVCNRDKALRIQQRRDATPQQGEGQPDEVDGGDTEVAAPLFAHNTHTFLLRGLLTDAREVCAELSLSAQSVCYLVPYTKKKKAQGAFELSVYPQGRAVRFQAMAPRSSLCRSLVIPVVLIPHAPTYTRLDIMLSAAPCWVQILLHQDKVTDPAAVAKGDYLAEDEVMMSVYEEGTVLLQSTGTATNMRDHALEFEAATPGITYTLLLACPSRAVTGECPCTVTVYTPKHVTARWVAAPVVWRPHATTREPASPRALTHGPHPPHTSVPMRRPQQARLHDRSSSSSGHAAQGNPPHSTSIRPSDRSIVARHAEPQDVANESRGGVVRSTAARRRKDSPDERRAWREGR